MLKRAEPCLRLNRRTRTLPLLMLTSAREQDLERQGLESGADAYVSKSADIDVMLARLRALLRRVRTAASEAAGRTGRRMRRPAYIPSGQHPSVTRSVRAIIATPARVSIRARAEATRSLTSSSSPSNPIRRNSFASAKPTGSAAGATSVVTLISLSLEYAPACPKLEIRARRAHALTSQLTDGKRPARRPANVNQLRI